MTHEPVARMEGVLLRGEGPRPRLAVESLALHRGEVLGLLGGNGAGKSTLLRALALLEGIDEGRIDLFGHDAARHDVLALRRRMAVVFQSPLLFDRTVLENAAMGLRFRGVPEGEATKRALGWLERLGIAPLAARPAREVSGGEAQRASLARALVLEPELLLLDEPFANLDAPSRSALLDDLQDLFDRERPTVLFVSHDREEVLRLAHRAAVLVEGRLAQLAPIEEVFNRPASPEIAALVGAETVVEVEILGTEDGLTRLRHGETELLATETAVTGPALCCVRPEEIVLARPEELVEDGTSALNHLRGRIRAIRPTGATLRVDVDCGFPLRVVITPRSAERLGLAEGAAISALIKASALHVLHRGTEGGTS